MVAGIGSPEEVEMLEKPSTNEDPIIRFIEDIHKKLRLFEIRIKKLEERDNEV